jgi:hypothetical protein
MFQRWSDGACDYPGNYKDQLQYSNTPLLHHSTTPILHHSMLSALCPAIPTSLRGVGPYAPYGPEAAFRLPNSFSLHHSSFLYLNRCSICRTILY